MTLMTRDGLFFVHHKMTLSVFLTTGTAPSHLFRMTSHLNRHLHNESFANTPNDVFRFLLLWRLPLLII